MLSNDYRDFQMSSEQIGQLYELMHATRDIWKKPEELGEQNKSASSTKDGSGSQS